MNTYYITLIILILIGFIYSFKTPTSIENFTNLPEQTRKILGQKIRHNDDIESTIELINNQINERERNDNIMEQNKTINKQINKQISNKQISNKQISNKQISNKQIYSNKNTTLAQVDLKNYIHKDNIPNISNYIHKDNMPNMSNYIHRNKVPNIGRYILKSEIPAPPNMNKYILKNQVPECAKLPSMNKYLLKSQIPPPKICPDLSKFVLKTSVPPIQKLVCPKPNCVKCNTKINKKAKSTKKPKNNKKHKNNTSEVNHLVPRNIPVHVNSVAKKKVTIKQPNMNPLNNIKNKLDIYKPKLGKRKCNVFYKIIKNADIYGAY